MIKGNLISTASAYAKAFGLPDPRNTFSSHKSCAKRRGIDFRLSFDEWWSLWVSKYHLRGVRKGEYVMCRTLDKGAYEIGNVRIDFAAANGHERKIANRAKHGCRFPSAGNKTLDIL